MKDHIPYKKLVKTVYGMLDGNIQCLKENLNSETPEAADRAWHNVSHDVDDYARFAQSCAMIDSMFNLLSSLRIPKTFRDMDFEKEAETWAAIQ